MTTTGEDQQRATSGPLNGIRILDLSSARAGGVAAMLLADLGADVVRTGGADRTTGWREAGGPAAEVCWDRGKRYVNLPSPDGIGDLIAGCDVVVIDDSPSEAERLGRSAASLAAAAPRTVVCWLPANGVVGPLADLPPDPLIVAAISGYAQLQSCMTETPIAQVVPVVSYVQAALGAAASVAALIERRRSGHGQVVSVSGLNASTLLTATLAGEALDHPTVVRPNRDYRTSASFRPYECGDGKWIFLGAIGPALLLKTLDALDLLELMVLPGIDGEYLNLFSGDNASKVSDAMERKFASQDAATWLARLAAADVPAALVQTRADWMADDLYAGVGGRLERHHSERGTIRTPAPSIVLSATPMIAGGFDGPLELRTADAVWRDGERETGYPVNSRATTSPFTSPPLAGLRVLDLSTFMAGPLGPMVLAQWGADVIKIEPTTHDPYRIFNLSYGAMNQGKRAVTLDLRRPAARAAFDALAADADVLVDNLRPSIRARLGLDSDALRAAYPRLVHTTISAFGDDGPAAERPGFDPVLQAASGLMHECGDDEQPYYTSTGIHDVGSGSLALLGTVAALYARERIGHGQRVSVSLARASQLMQLEELTDYRGRPPTRRGGAAYVGPTLNRRYYRALDGWVAICAADDQADIVSGWAGDGTAESTERLEAAIARRFVVETVEGLSALGVAATAVVEADGRRDSAHLAAHRVLHLIEDPGIGRCRINNEVAAWGRSSVVEARSIPPLGTDVPSWRPSP